jgi:DNA-binding GntR family transcriptional regulator
MTADEARGLYEVRAVLEALAGRQFTERATDDQRAALKQALEKLASMRDMQGQEGTMSFLKQKAQFYDVMLDGANNPVLTEMLRLVHTRVMMLRATTLSQAGRLPQSYDEIATIVDAVMRNDADAAAAACKRHVERAESLAVEVLAAASS